MKFLAAAQWLEALLPELLLQGSVARELGSLGHTFPTTKCYSAELVTGLHITLCAHYCGATNMDFPQSKGMLAFLF